MSRYQNKDNEVVVSYHDCILRKNDVSLLEGPHWLNDAVIGFYFEYLGQRHKHSRHRLLFISPELTQLLKLTDSHEYPIFLDPIKATEKDFIFFPVNDCSSRYTGGGTHWSLVVFSRLEKTCYSFDSSRGMNAGVAREFSRSIMRYLLDKGKGQFVEVETPLQENGYDCGLFVLCFADIISDYIATAAKVEGCNCDSVRRQVSEKRRSLMSLIDKLKIGFSRY